MSIIAHAHRRKYRRIAPSDRERSYPVGYKFFCGYINFNRVINDRATPKSTWTAEENRWLPEHLFLERRREDASPLPRGVLFFALTWPTCSVRYARRVIHRNPSTTAIQTSAHRCIVKQPVINHAEELGSSEPRINPISSLRIRRSLVTTLLQRWKKNIYISYYRRNSIILSMHADWAPGSKEIYAILVRMWSL